MCPHTKVEWTFAEGNPEPMWVCSECKQPFALEPPIPFGEATDSDFGAWEESVKGSV